MPAQLTVGGQFKHIGDVLVSGLAVRDGNQWIPIGEGVAGQVLALDRMPGGELVIGGTFASAGGTIVNHIAVWDGSQFSAIGGGVGTTVLTLKLDPEGRIFAGGLFTSAGGNPVGYVACWDGSTWQSMAGGMDSRVRSIDIDANGNVIAGGAFTTAGGVEADRIASWNGSEWTPLGSGLNDTITRVAVLSDGTVLAGGVFTASGTTPATRIARWDGASWEALGGGVPDAPASVAEMPDGRLIVGCGMNNSFSGNRLLSWDGVTWSALGSGIDSSVNTLQVLDDGRLFAGGGFATAGGVPAPYAAVWDESTWSPINQPTTGLAPDGDVLAFTRRGNDQVVVAGGFEKVAGEPSALVAIWQGDQWVEIGASLAPESGAAYAAVAMSDESVILGGTLDIEELGSTRLIRWDGQTWSGIPIDFQTPLVLSLAESADGRLLMGDFSGTQLVARVREWDGLSWSTVGSVLEGPIPPEVSAILPIAPDNILVGGTFTTGSGTVLNRITRWNGSAWTYLNSGVNGAVKCIAVTSTGDVIVGGQFTTAGWLTARGIARWDGNQWWPIGGTGTSTANVRAVLVLPNDDILAGGFFSSLGGVPASNLARWDGGQWSPLGGGTRGIVNALCLLPDGDIMVGGGMRYAGEVPSDNVAIFSFGSPTINGSLASTSNCGAGTFRVTLNAVGRFPLLLEWQIESDPGVWTPIGTGPTEIPCGGAASANPISAREAEIVIAPCPARLDYRIRCMVTNSCGSVTSDPISYRVLRTDLNDSAAVGLEDLAALLTHFGVQAGATRQMGDVNGDGDVDLADLAELLSAFGVVCD